MLLKRHYTIAVSLVLTGALTLAAPQVNSLALQRDLNDQVVAPLHPRQDDGEDGGDDGASETEGQDGFGGGEQPQQGDQGQLGNCEDPNLDATCDPGDNGDGDGGDGDPTTTIIMAYSTSAYEDDYTSTNYMASTTTNNGIFIPTITSSNSNANAAVGVPSSRMRIGAAAAGAVIAGVLVTLF